MLTSLILPIIIATVAVFFFSFLSWMVLGIHRQDWRKLPGEEALLQSVRQTGAAPGNYMFPGCDTPEEMKSPEHQKRLEAGPCGVVTIFADVNMGKNLGLTFVYFLVVNFCLAYLATLGLSRGAEFMPVFRFVATAGWMTYFAAIVPHAIWFRCRIVGHVIESIAFAAIVGGVFAGMWPA